MSRRSSNRTPQYLVAAGEDADTLIPLTAGMSSKPLFDKFEPEAYAQVLEEFTGYPDSVIRNGSQIRTWLEENGQPLEIRIGQEEWDRTDPLGRRRHPRGLAEPGPLCSRQHAGGF